VAAIMALTPGVEPPLHAANAGALGVLEAARWALARGNSFRDGALRAINLGGNADVIGAVYGQLAGAHYGAGAIPSGWLASLALHDQISALADRLLTLALVRRGEL
jgi:ADP-ribosyl-[dinitrogen reductase] hydrolase